MDKIRQRMTELQETLDRAAKVYYSEGREIMSNAEYDRLYDELEALEEETGIVLNNSITQRVGYETVSSLKKVRHSEKMLSLSKTKSVDKLTEWLGDKEGVLSWKLDGLTVVLTYKEGSLVSAVTRGNGEVGEDVTHNILHIHGLPFKVPFKEKTVIRGEVLMTYSEFERINAEYDVDAGYKNPRNLAAGTLRQLDSSVLSERRLEFFAFNFVSGKEGINSFSASLDFLESIGFQAVPHVLVTSSSLRERVADFKSGISSNDFPSDGLVLFYDDIEYGRSLGVTAKFPRNGIAFKWEDEAVESVLREVEWSASRTGLLNPVAIFDTVEIEGTNVSRASLHNISMIEKLKLGIGDRIRIYKANMIIPQILDNLTESDSLPIPEHCPVCGALAEIRRGEADTKTLYCTNPDCTAKHSGKFEHFVSRDAMNIVGMSTAAISSFISHGFLRELSDIYRLKEHREEIIGIEGFKDKSCDKLLEAVETSRKTELSRLIYSLGIANIGVSASRLIADKFKSLENIMSADAESLREIEGIGDVIAESVLSFFADEKNRSEVTKLAAELEIAEVKQADTASGIAGLTFVITGSLENFANRSELKAFLESKGAKVASSVSKKTDYLINNDVNSTSSKNLKARETGTAIINEKELLDLLK